MSDKLNKTNPPRDAKGISPERQAVIDAMGERPGGLAREDDDLGDDPDDDVDDGNGNGAEVPAARPRRRSSARPPGSRARSSKKR
jgi:hypothetical protein